jgi:hypothetical protein
LGRGLRLVFFCSSVPVRAGLLKPDVDYSNYQTPLLLQMVNRIKAKIAARSGGRNLTPATSQRTEPKFSKEVAPTELVMGAV